MKVILLNKSAAPVFALIAISNAIQAASQIVVLYDTMDHRTKKYERFVCEPMADKPITAVSGINEELGAKLAAKGFDKAYILLGQFLLLKKECAAFQNWLKVSYGASSCQAEQCALCLLEWCYAFL
ncbi:hypothetical protein JRQ81_012742 [Phrynocephalus forsythii]|uniref:Barrier-to-autointegration factor-like protein n=1 Tax=Phrynocephalus forsythii TaxID=171643 RepID=A0A9Q1B676_9SAUR|nr:hypothetical protein JRQ81_012742 [Phrynocephalus forsythii]